VKVLLLGGTIEARQLAGFLAESSVPTVASLAGVTTDPTPYPVEIRSGGFGGEVAQEQYLKEGRFTHLIDATHPFATQISTRSCAIANRLGLPYLRILRPAWKAREGDDWYEISTPDEAAALVPKGARVLLATGAASVHEWKALAPGRMLWCRRVDATDAVFPFKGGWIVGRPPFSLDEEQALLNDLQVNWLVTRNAGGPTRAKLLAARALQIPVVMLKRPPRLICDHVETADQALSWLTKQNA